MESHNFIYNPVKQPKGPKRGQVFKAILPDNEYRCLFLRDYFLGVFSRWGPQRKSLSLYVGINLAGDMTYNIGTENLTFVQMTIKDWVELSSFLLRNNLAYNIKRKQILVNKKTVLHSWK